MGEKTYRIGNRGRYYVDSNLVFYIREILTSPSYLKFNSGVLYLVKSEFVDKI